VNDTYQSGGIRPSHLRAPRLSSDASYVESFPTVSTQEARTSWLAWSGWVVAAVMLFVFIVTRGVA
jgi:uncharacterized integral membrane protein